jgi:hypothetical protein
VPTPVRGQTRVTRQPGTRQLSPGASLASHSLSAAAQMSRSVLLRWNSVPRSAAISSGESTSGSYTKSMVRDPASPLSSSP